MQKRAKIYFCNLPDGAKSPTLVVSNYVFDTEHEDYSVSWLFRKLDRYENMSSFTSDDSNVRCEGDETPTSRLRMKILVLTEEDLACKKKLFEKNSSEACIEDIGCVEDYQCKCEGHFPWEEYGIDQQETSLNAFEKGSLSSASKVSSSKANSKD